MTTPTFGRVVRLVAMAFGGLCWIALGGSTAGAEPQPRDARQTAPVPTASASAAPAAAAVDDDVENLRAEYRRLGNQVETATTADAAVLSALRRRIVWGLASLDGDAVVARPELEPEKAQQLAFDRAVVDEALGDVPLPVVETPGAHEAVPAGATFEPVAYFVPVRSPERMLVMLPGQRESESDVISRLALQRLADDSRTLLVVPSLDGARSLDDVAKAVAAADAAFASRFRIEPAKTYLGGVSLGASLAFEVPQRLHRNFAGYLAIDGTLPGGDTATLLSSMSRTSSAAYFVAGGRDAHVPASAIRASVTRCRAAGVAALYFEQPDGVASIASLAPAIGDAWRAMIRGVTTIPNDGLGTLPGDSLPAGIGP